MRNCGAPITLNLDTVLNHDEMQAMEMKCCLQRLQMASYLKHKSSWSYGYPSPLVCHAVHKSNSLKPREFNIILRYQDMTKVIIQIFYKTNTECLLRILWNSQEIHFWLFQYFSRTFSKIFEIFGKKVWNKPYLNRKSSYYLNLF